MRQVGIVTDSTSDITPQIAQELDIDVVPLHVAIGRETFTDGDLTQEEFFLRMEEASSLPTTSQPSVGAFAEAYRSGLEGFERIVSVHISAALSGTIESAHEAARQFGGRVEVFDTRNLSWGEALQVGEAARAAAAGASVSDVLRVLEHARSHVRMVVGLDTLDNLAKGGRIGKVAALVGGLLNMRVLITMNEHGSFDVAGKARGATAALETTVEWVAKQMGDVLRGRFVVMHALSADKAEWLESRLRELFDVVELRVIKAGAVITTHTGTGWGVEVLPIEG
ncbi:MAG TPA: DegV family protein [Coriobacteriia bacterium]|nr:DegV family protein [Coriobacteriia bacterium]